MRPTLHLRITADRVRVELDGRLLLDEEAAIALRFNARTGAPQILAYGRDTVALPGRIVDLANKGVMDDGYERACIVPAAEAKWWEPIRTLAPSDSLPDVSEPWEHHGEIVIVHPFAQATATPFLWPATLHWAYFSALAKEPLFRREWLHLRRRVAIELPELPPDARVHDDLVRHFRERFGRRVTINGSRAQLQAPPKLTELTWKQWGLILLPFTLLTLKLRIWRGLPPMRLLVMAVVVGTAMSIAVVRRVLEGDPVDRHSPAPRLISTPKQLYRYGAPTPVVDPTSFANHSSFQLGVLDSVSKLGVLLFTMAVFVSCAVLLQLSLEAGIAKLLTFGAASASAWLAAHLASTRLALGERGITLRLRGRLSRPVRIPYARIRHVIAGDVATLRMVFHDDHEVRIGFAVNLERRIRLLRDIESALVPHLTPPGSYRAPGTGGAG